MGRHRKTTIEELQVLTWYYLVRSKCDLDNKALSRRFCGLTESQIEFGEKNVPKIFERIQANAQMPSTGKHHYRDYDLIKRVEADDNFSGTERTYVSPFWQLLKEHPFSIASTSRLIECSLKACRAIRLNREQQLAIHVNFLDEKFEALRNSASPISENFMRSHLPVAGVMHLSQLQPYSLDVIGLAGALFRESYLVFDLERAIHFRREYERLVSAYASQEWMKPIAEHFVDHVTEKLTMDYKSTPDEDRSLDQRGNLIIQMDEIDLEVFDSLTEECMRWIRQSMQSDHDEKCRCDI